VDPGICVFIKEGELYVMALYVDNNIIVGPAGSFIVRFKSAFGVRFNEQDLGPMSWLLGMTIERDRGNRIIGIGQRQFVLDMHERFNMVECEPVGSPMAVDALSNCVETSTSKLPPGSGPYQSFVAVGLLSANCGHNFAILLPIVVVSVGGNANKKGC
jgi:hypothetical protein